MRCLHDVNAALQLLLHAFQTARRSVGRHPVACIAVVPQLVLLYLLCAERRRIHLLLGAKHICALEVVGGALVANHHELALEDDCQIVVEVAVALRLRQH